MEDNKKTSRFIKAIGVTIEHHNYIVSTKYKKSIAGRLEEIIEYFKKHNK